MPLDQAQQQKVQEWWASKGVNPDCPSCGRNHWEIGEIINTPVVVPTGMALGGGVPMVQVACTHCYYIRLYAAGPIGLLLQQP